MSEILPVDRDHPDDGVLRRVVDVVGSGGLIVYPTETLYGIGADATNPVALRKIPGVKRRTDRKPILVIVDSVEMMMPLVEDIPPVARLLMESLWPGPLTLVFSASKRVAPELTQGTGTIGIRIPSSRLCLRLTYLLGVPLTSTSANISGTESSRAIGGMAGSLNGIDIFLDAGELPESLPSTIVDVSGAVPRVLRDGAVSVDELRHIVTEIET